MKKRLLVEIALSIFVFAVHFNLKPFVEVGHENGLNYVLSTFATYEMETSIPNVTIGGDVGFYQFTPDWNYLDFDNGVKRARVLINYNTGFGDFYIGTNLANEGAWAVGGYLF